MRSCLSLNSEAINADLRMNPHESAHLESLTGRNIMLELIRLRIALEDAGFNGIQYFPEDGRDEAWLLLEWDGVRYTFHYDESWSEELVREQRRYAEMYPESEQVWCPPKVFFMYEDDELLGKSETIEGVLDFFVPYFSQEKWDGKEIPGTSYACGYDWD
jgi:hypothetical protein